ncbi:MAG: VanW family protein [Candidatus Peregrinibacteria bacterium GW2011_GWC2_39_14]|nr:MAG: VanW family protein [Candidatus Peregrinibacteria bacterium GW2011_GWA2_38_36]KKR07097.1 MAG: VanW family protein [Candidatus Peregrinibacteria bacterium GW2011_GWC2_39_14]
MSRKLKVAKYVGAILIILMIVAAVIFGGKPSYVIAGVLVEDVNLIQKQEEITAKIKDFQDKKIQFTYNGKTVYISPSDIGVEMNLKETIDKIKKSNRIGFFMDPIYMPLENKFDQAKLSDFIKTEFKDDIREMQEARIVLNKGNFEITKEQEGSKLDEKQLTDDMKAKLNNALDAAVDLKFTKTPPTILAEDLSVNFERIKTALNKNIAVKYDKKSYPFYPKTFLDAVFFQKEYKLITEDVAAGQFVGSGIKIKLNPEFTKKSFTANIAQEIDKKASSVKIYKDKNDKVIVEGHGDVGEEVDQDKLIELLEIAMNENVQIVKIPIIETSPEVSISEDLQALGIKELIGTGHTSYYNSPKNRIYNIANGVAKFNGVLIKPDEVFSFNKTLGKVDETTGYLKELVIRPEGTVPEYGGGLCQVSSTMYRAAIYTGLPIVERSPHSYAVTYYSQIGGHGLDATIYPGVHDLKFKNDTGAYILVQSYTDSLEAYYKFYGTSDGRKVAMDGPYLGNYKDARKEEIVKTKDLAPGGKKMIEHAGKGFDAVWYRTMTYSSGLSTKETIFSQYRPTANRYTVGYTVEELAQQAAQNAQNGLPVKAGEFKD